MSEPFLAEIRLVGFNFAPNGWASCDGQVLPISQATALFSLLGTTYGGNGQSTFALPNLAGRTPMHWGQALGLSPVVEGETGGTESVILRAVEMPSHTHGAQMVSTAAANSAAPSAGRSLAVTSASAPAYGAPAGQDLTPMGDLIGGGQAHENRQPYLKLNFVIALQGIYPARS